MRERESVCLRIEGVSRPLEAMIQLPKLADNVLLLGTKYRGPKTADDVLDLKEEEVHEVEKGNTYRIRLKNKRERKAKRCKEIG